MSADVHFLPPLTAEVSFARAAGRAVISRWRDAYGVIGHARIEPFGPWQFIVHTAHPKECAEAAHEADGDGMRVESTIVDGGVVLTIRRAK